MGEANIKTAENLIDAKDLLVIIRFIIGAHLLPMVSGVSPEKSMTETQTPSVIVEASAIEKKIYIYIYGIIW